MNTQTVLLIILAFIVALALAVFQYYYRSKKRGRLNILLSSLRFLSLFGLLILLINPKFSRDVFTIEKPNLVVLVDNSSSVQANKADVVNISKLITNDVAVVDRFNIATYQFDRDLHDSDSLTFLGKNTNISKALSSLNDIYSQSNTAVVLLTDGNQTIGNDYTFYGENGKLNVYPIVLGDTTRYEDLRIDQVNVNRFAFLKNKYPIEAFVSYQGQRDVDATVSITLGRRRVHRENIRFTNTKNTHLITALVEANSVGTKSIQVSISVLENERNTVNNKKDVAIEVIDEKTNVAIISDLTHPDIGTLKKAIESNKQRSVTIMKPSISQKELEDVDLFILYQPNTSFTSVYKYIETQKANRITITGTQTGWNFLNSIQKKFQIRDDYPVQEVFPVLNSGYSKYDISDHSFEGYPPLESNGGGIQMANEFEVLLNMQIRGIDVRDPLLSVVTDDISREALLLGENIWKWRMHCFRENQDFKNFDDFIGKLILFLSNKKARDRLRLDYQSIYEGSNDAKITASYFDEAFDFDSNANISLLVKGKSNTISREMPMLLKGSYYESDLSGLDAGDYDFTVTVKNENRSKSGSFTILDFDVEEQFTSSDYQKLGVLASNTQGRLYFPSQADSLIDFVAKAERFRPIQSSTKNVVSLIDFRILLGVIAAALALEWFIRKYNGLI